jgi:hypothetical protein
MLNRQEPTREGEPAIESAAELERRVLGALCLGACEGPIAELARSMLAGYRWREPAHAAVFDIVMSFPASSAAALREQLAARLTRRGFPDFDVAAWFALPQCSEREVGEWMRRLRELPEDDR